MFKDPARAHTTVTLDATGMIIDLCDLPHPELLETLIEVWIDIREAAEVAHDRRMGGDTIGVRAHGQGRLMMKPPCPYPDATQSKYPKCRLSWLTSRIGLLSLIYNRPSEIGDFAAIFNNYPVASICRPSSNVKLSKASRLLSKSTESRKSQAKSHCRFLIAAWEWETYDSMVSVLNI